MSRAVGRTMCSAPRRGQLHIDCRKPHNLLSNESSLILDLRFPFLPFHESCLHSASAAPRSHFSAWKFMPARTTRRLLPPQPRSTDRSHLCWTATLSITSSRITRFDTTMPQWPVAGSFWDSGTATGEEIRIFEHPDRVESVRFVPDGNRLKAFSFAPHTGTGTGVSTSLPLQ